MKTKIIVSIIVLVVFAAGITLIYLFVKPRGNPVYCTMEAKICPDGTAVGRSGPNCEFAECPVSETNNWITYINQEDGVEIKYPNNFIKTEGPVGTPNNLILLLEDPSFHRGYTLLIRPASVSERDTSAWAQRVPGDNKVITPMVIDGIEGKKVVVTAQQTEGIVERHFFSIVKNNILYTISYVYNDNNGIKIDDPEKEKTVNYFDQIVSSFKFID